MDFDTVGNIGLGGWFSCKSNEIIPGLEAKIRNAIAQRKEYERKLRVLKTGSLQREIEGYEKLQEELKSDFDKAKKLLDQTEQVAKVHGLGAFCKHANARRRDKERDVVRESSLLGEAKRAYEAQVNRHKHYLPLLRSNVRALKADISAVNTKIKSLKDNIQKKKDAEVLAKQAEQLRISQEAVRAEAEASKKLFGISKKTLLAITGVGILYFIKKKGL